MTCVQRSLLGLLVVGGCGLGVHRNPTAAVTAPYHDHQAEIAAFPAVHASSQPVALAGVGVGAFARYYARPIGFRLGTAAGPAKSWGRGTILTWSPIEPAAAPEQAVQAAFASQLGGAPADGELVVSGVVTDVSWYVVDATTGGRITTKLVVTRRDGSVVYEGERSTVGRAGELRGADRRPRRSLARRSRARSGGAGGGAMRIVLGMALALAACLPPRSATATFETPAAVAAATDKTVTLAPLIDARPAALRRSHVPSVSRYTGLALVYFAFGTGRTDGADHAGDARTTLTVDGVSGTVQRQLEAYVSKVLAAATGTAPARGTAAELDNVQRAASGAADGIVVVPILDQFDDFRMESRDTISGGSSYQSGSKQITTSGVATGSAKTDLFANLRLRLVLFDVRGGRIVRQSIAYVATSEAGYDALGKVLVAGVEPITRQLAAFVAGS